MNKSVQAQPSVRNEGDGYFNLHASGCGYLSRVRWVEPGQRRGGRSADPFLACAINALRGDVENSNYTYFDLRVSGREAMDLIEQLQPAVDEGRKVFVAFRLGDFYADPYEREVKDEHGRKTGKFELAASIKGRLLLITHVKIDGEVFFAREDDAAHGDNAEAPAQAADDAAESAAVPEAQPQSRQRISRAPQQQRQAPADRTKVRSYADSNARH